jgi:hypothetical protein
MSSNIFNVNSYGQLGGITAGQVNLGRPWRQLDEGFKAELKTFPRDKPIKVYAAAPDGETTSLARAIETFFNRRASP